MPTLVVKTCVGLTAALLIAGSAIVIVGLLDLRADSSKKKTDEPTQAAPAPGAEDLYLRPTTFEAPHSRPPSRPRSPLSNGSPAFATNVPMENGSEFLLRMPTEFQRQDSLPPTRSASPLSVSTVSMEDTEPDNEDWRQQALDGLRHDLRWFYMKLVVARNQAALAQRIEDIRNRLATIDAATAERESTDQDTDSIRSGGSTITLSTLDRERTEQRAGSVRSGTSTITPATFMRERMADSRT
ncbi:hypothetical protein K490DRAFT_61888 [Saccharata proteae CBS 121410]|uniref:Uncharacterized protein n=1 Tax=Saccharata proteae CBS 121410 TaxID=1314787 RepID=A0A9P4LYQ8_9PEZI|nr:hypothetical protein K490DRAFT_61888 [Saccharata proteae CBS 121410]